MIDLAGEEEVSLEEGLAKPAIALHLMEVLRPEVRLEQRQRRKLVEEKSDSK